MSCQECPALALSTCQWCNVPVLINSCREAPPPTTPPAAAPSEPSTSRKVSPLPNTHNYTVYGCTSYCIHVLCVCVCVCSGTILRLAKVARVQRSTGRKRKRKRERRKRRNIKSTSPVRRALRYVNIRDFPIQCYTWPMIKTHAPPAEYVTWQVMWPCWLLLYEATRNKKVYFAYMMFCVGLYWNPSCITVAHMCSMTAGRGSTKEEKEKAQKICWRIVAELGPPFLSSHQSHSIIFLCAQTLLGISGRIWISQCAFLITRNQFAPHIRYSIGPATAVQVCWSFPLEIRHVETPYSHLAEHLETTERRGWIR